MFDGIDIAKLSEVMGKVMASADLSILMSSKFNEAKIYYKIDEKDSKTIHLKIIMEPADVNIEKKIIEVIKIINALSESDKIKIIKVG